MFVFPTWINYTKRYKNALMFYCIFPMKRL